MTNKELNRWIATATDEELKRLAINIHHQLKMRSTMFVQTETEVSGSLDRLTIPVGDLQ